MDTPPRIQSGYARIFDSQNFCNHYIRPTGACSASVGNRSQDEYIEEDKAEAIYLDCLAPSRRFAPENAQI